MREVLHLTPADARRLPWKNGRGFTEELALWPPGGAFERGDFGWRVSQASIEEPGPFSVFEGFDRILVVTRGEGVVLTHGDRAPRARLRRFEPYLFCGDWPTAAELPSGAVRDFNVLVRRELFEANVEVLQLGRRRVRESLGPGHALVHAIGGGVVARVTGAEEPFDVAARESLWARGLVEGDELDLVGRHDACVVLLVRIGAARENFSRSTPL